MSVRTSFLLAIALSCPLAALYACGSSPPVAPLTDAGLSDTRVPDTSVAPDVGPFDSGGVFPCDMKICGLGTEVCCFSTVGTGQCMAVVDAAALPICTPPANEYDCAATGDCEAGVCCAQQQGSSPIHSLCQVGCQPTGPVTVAVVLCNGPYDTTTCKGGKKCISTVGAYPAGYYFCSN